MELTKNALSREKGLQSIAEGFAATRDTFVYMGFHQDGKYFFMLDGDSLMYFAAEREFFTESGDCGKGITVAHCHLIPGNVVHGLIMQALNGYAA